MQDLTVFGRHDQATLDQMANCLVGPAARGVLCADGHLGYSQPVGGVVGYRDAVSISGVGYDIACGNMAVRLPVTAAQIRDALPAIAQRINERISFGIGRRNAERVEAECLEDDPAWKIREVRPLRAMAQEQLGTVGGGNHYVNLFEDEQGMVWIGVHFGSRGLGHRIATHFRNAAGGKEGIMVPPTLVTRGTDLAEEYLLAMQLAGRYAYAGREWVCREVARIVQGTEEWTDEVHNHHNYVWEEEHGGETLLVVRKGATPAFPGQRGFVGGSMADGSVILRGMESERAKAALYSTVHGAGRVMGRREAAGKWRWKGGRRVLVEPGKVDERAMRAEVARQGIVLVGGGADEAPQVYRRLEDVLAEHAGTIEIEHRLTPLAVVMAPPELVDPFKD
ncbi:RtcB family protein [Geminicoccus harenae]|uniref:RtcB family protein n=1 Tax=Geminicoccus harenae TaxID=2498453 RepID=UPI00168B602F|nr:RtcB family protein [Geminicoccus harenae]